MRRLGIISDIHGNLHALEAVFARMAMMDLDAIACLGDIVGYGPAAEPCIDLVTRYCTTIVQGNHDEAVVDPSCANTFNGPAREAILWTRQRMTPLRMNALQRLKTTEYVNDQVMCVHDCPVPAPTDYVHDRSIAAMAFRGVDVPVCLLGHTHVPMVFETFSEYAEADVLGREVIAHVMNDNVPLPLVAGRRYICNPGSVGQPRDCDPRASFAVLDMDAMTFTVHREAYDIAAAQAATLKAGLPTVLADRLAIGA